MKKSHPKCLVIAHRGASSYLPENTLAAFEQAIAMGADAIELDIRATADQILVVHHDRGIKIGKHKYWVDKLNYTKLDNKTKNRLIRLEEVINQFKDRTILNLDIKQWGIENQISFLLSQHNLREAVMIDYYYHLPGLIKFRNVFPKAVVSLSPILEDRRDLGKHISVRLVLNLTTIVLKYFIHNLILKKVIELVGVDGVTIHYRLVNRKLIELLHREGVKVYVWRIDKEKLMKKYLRWGVDGIKTGRPDVLRKLILAEKN